MDNLKLKLEELGVEQELIDNIMNEMIDNKKMSITPPISSSTKDKAFELKNTLNKIPKKDWRERAKIAAQIISEDLSTWQVLKDGVECKYMKKQTKEIVINKCYGGFGLSNEAYEQLIKWGIPVRKYINEKRNPKTGLYDIKE